MDTVNNTNKREVDMDTYKAYTPKEYRGDIKYLEIGVNYASIFGLDADKANKMIYNGGMSWTAINGLTNASKTLDSQKTTECAINYINRPSISMGNCF
jgi:hypothetical protein